MLPVAFIVYTSRLCWM